jgi:hypothetical protein
MIKSEAKRLFSRPMLYVAFIVGVFLINRPLIEDVLAKTTGPGSISQFLSVPFALSDFSPFAAIFCVLPYADSFCEDYNTGYYRLTVCRSGSSKYALFRSAYVALSGGLVMAGIVLITILFCGSLANLPETPDRIEFMRHSIWVRSGIIYVMNGIPYLALRVVFGFLFGCVWSLIGLFISTIMTNKYVTYIAPFVLYQMLWFVLSETKWNPVYQWRGDMEFIPSISFVLIYQTALIVILLTVSSLMIRRKVRS